MYFVIWWHHVIHGGYACTYLTNAVLVASGLFPFFILGRAAVGILGLAVKISVE